MPKDIYHLRTQVAKALANPLRLKIIDQLDTEQEKCVCELVDALGCDQPSVSKHLAVLRSAGLVTSRQEGTKILYRLRAHCIKDFLRCIDRVIRQDFQEKAEEIGRLTASLNLGEK